MEAICIIPISPRLLIDERLSDSSDKNCVVGMFTFSKSFIASRYDTLFIAVRNAKNENMMWSDAWAMDGTIYANVILKSLVKVVNDKLVECSILLLLS